MAAMDSGEPPPKLQAWRERGAGWKLSSGREDWGSRFMTECCRLAFMLGNLEKLEEVCRRAAFIVFPGQNIDAKKFPTREQIRLAVIKLDFLHSLSRRRLFLPGAPHVSRHLGMDASPQGNWDYNCVTEELMVRYRFAIPVPFNPWEGFEWVRRSLPVSTNARGKTKTCNKKLRAFNSIVIEAGDENFPTYRTQSKTYLRYQAGAERNIMHGTVGNRQLVKDVLQAVRAGNMNMADDLVKDILLLPDAMEQFDCFHVLYNALKRALESLPEWEEFLELLKAICKVLGEKSYKEVCMKTWFKKADRA